MKKLIFLTVVLAIVVAFLPILVGGQQINAEADTEIKVYFYVNRDEEPVKVISELTGWQFPGLDRKRDGYEFIGWLDEGGVAFYAPGTVFEGTLTYDLVFYAAYKEVPQETSLLSTTEKIILIIVISILLLLILLSYHWFVIKKRNFKDLALIFKKKENKPEEKKEETEKQSE